MALAVISPAKANPSVCVHAEQKKKNKNNEIWHKSLDDVIVKWLAVPHSRVCLAIIH